LTQKCHGGISILECPGMTLILNTLTFLPSMYLPRFNHFTSSTSIGGILWSATSSRAPIYSSHTSAALTYLSGGRNHPPTHMPDTRYPGHASGVRQMVRVWSGGLKGKRGNPYLGLDTLLKTAESSFTETSNNTGAPVEHITDPTSQTSIHSEMNRTIQATNTIGF
jgi:hypothetical protein